MLSPAVAGVLRRSTIGATSVRLPEGQLARPLYADVDKALKALGGRWNRSAGAHVFDREIADEFQAMLGEGFVIDQKKTLEQFFTPAHVAEQMADLIGLRASDHLLEPSAGMGALLAPGLKLSCCITAVEKDERLADGLQGLLGGMHGCGIWCDDFMKWEPRARAPITAVMMNPPFSCGQDAEHVRKAFGHLARGGRMGAIVGEHAFIASDRRSVEFRAWCDEIGVVGHELGAGTFKASGTMVATRVLIARKR